MKAKKPRKVMAIRLNEIELKTAKSFAKELTKGNVSALFRLMLKHLAD
jgi:hypothetical protein